MLKATDQINLPPDPPLCVLCRKKDPVVQLQHNHLYFLMQFSCSVFVSNFRGYSDCYRRTIIPASNIHVACWAQMRRSPLFFFESFCVRQWSFLGFALPQSSASPYSPISKSIKKLERCKKITNVYVLLLPTAHKSTRSITTSYSCSGCRKVGCSSAICFCMVYVAGRGGQSPKLWTKPYGFPMDKLFCTVSTKVRHYDFIYTQIMIQP